MRTAQSSRPAQEILVESLCCPILSHPTSTGYEALGAFKLGAAGYPSVPAFWATARTAAKSSTKICGIPCQCPHDVRWLHIEHSRSTARKSLVNFMINLRSTNIWKQITWSFADLLKMNVLKDTMPRWVRVWSRSAIAQLRLKTLLLLPKE